MLTVVILLNLLLLPNKFVHDLPQAMTTLTRLQKAPLDTATLRKFYYLNL